MHFLSEQLLFQTLYKEDEHYISVRKASPECDIVTTNKERKYETKSTEMYWNEIYWGNMRIIYWQLLSAATMGSHEGLTLNPSLL